MWKTALKIFIWFTLDYCVANIDKTFFGRPYRLNGTKIRLDASLMAMWRGKLYVVIVRLMSVCEADESCREEYVWSPSYLTVL